MTVTKVCQQCFIVTEHDAVGDLGDLKCTCTRCGTVSTINVVIRPKDEQTQMLNWGKHLKKQGDDSNTWIP